jgi:AraC family transcriptional regulator, transcriptional activator of the genes for pyochelin and ferripyochelin receptors
MENLAKLTQTELEYFQHLFYRVQFDVDMSLHSQLRPITESRQLNAFEFKQIKLYEAWIEAGTEVNLKSQMHSLGIGFQLQGSGETTFTGAGFTRKITMPPMTYNLLYQTDKVTGYHRLPMVTAYHFFNINFTPERFMELISSSRLLTEKYQRIIAGEPFYQLWDPYLRISPPVLQSLDALRQIDFNNPLAEMLAEAMVMSIIVHVHTSTEDKTTRREAQVLHQVKQYLEENYLESISLKSLCRQFGVNEFSLKKGFKAEFNNTIFGYIQQLRMEKAKVLLLSGKSIKEVAADVGYEHPQHFSTAFRKWYNIKPSEWGEG